MEPQKAPATRHSRRHPEFCQILLDVFVSRIERNRFAEVGDGSIAPARRGEFHSIVRYTNCTSSMTAMGHVDSAMSAACLFTPR